MRRVQDPATRFEGIPGSTLPGPFPVGAYSRRLQEFLRGRARVQIVGEVFNLRRSAKRTYFELRDGDGAVPCAIWNDELERTGLPTGALSDGVQVVAAGGPDYYPGSRSASPSFSFDVSALRVAGEGDLLAQVERLRRRLAAEGLLEPQRLLPRPQLPKTIGVVTGESGKARDDVLAGLARRGWKGRIVWAFAPVQDRRAAPAITRALQDLAAVGGVEVIVVARGGGSIADLLAFCDETLCRTVALLPVPVIASVGHHTDRPLIDDVAAVACSTPTHAAEVAVPLHCGEAHDALGRAAVRLRQHARHAVLSRARTLVALSREPAAVVARHRRVLHQHLREMRASALRRGLVERRRDIRTRALVIGRKADAARNAAAQRARLDALSAVLAAHDPHRVVERGYAIVDDGRITTAAQARAVGRVRLTFSDADVPARIEDE